MTVVNPQITDAVSSPVEAMEWAHAKAAADAVTAQQQFYVIAQAATTQSVTTMLSFDVSATAAEVKKDLHEAAAAVRAHAPAASGDQTQSHGDDAPRLSGLAHEMNALGEAYCANLMRIVQIAAVSACTTAMIARPEKADAYLLILEAIKKFV